MSRLLLLATLAMVGCGSGKTPAVDFDTANDRFCPKGAGYCIRDFHLKDGTRCVANSEGGVTCDWKSSRGVE